VISCASPNDVAVGQHKPATVVVEDEAAADALLDARFAAEEVLEGIRGLGDGGDDLHHGRIGSLNRFDDRVLVGDDGPQCGRRCPAAVTTGPSTGAG
jgi:hypothetical protein